MKLRLTCEDAKSLGFGIESLSAAEELCMLSQCSLKSPEPHSPYLYTEGSKVAYLTGLL